MFTKVLVELHPHSQHNVDPMVNVALTDSGNQNVYIVNTMTDGPYRNHLAEFMQAAGLTDPALAQALGITKQQIFNLRRGHRKLTVEWAKRLAPHLNVSWQQLITGSPPVADDPTLTDLVAVYETMNHEQRQALLTVAKVMSPPQTTAHPTPGPAPPPKRRAAA